MTAGRVPDEQLAADLATAEEWAADHPQPRYQGDDVERWVAYLRELQELRLITAISQAKARIESVIAAQGKTDDVLLEEPESNWWLILAARDELHEAIACCHKIFRTGLI